MGLGAGQTRRSKHGAKSSSSTVLWDSATFLEDWKQQIKGKGSIPANQQRLTFASQRVNKEPVVLANFSPRRQWQLLVNATVEELCKDLQSWHAVLRTKNKSARLVSPLVLTEFDNRASSLHSRTAQELRQIGVPCDVYYLSFDKWIPSRWPEISEEDAEGVQQPREINCQIDEQFQQNTFFIDLDGQLNGECLPMPLSYVMNGRDVTVKLSMLEQTARYREGQKIRHKLTTPASEALHSLVKEENVIEIKSWGSEFENYVVHFEKDREFTAIISREHRQLRCIILPVVTVPLHGANSAQEQEQIVGDSKGAIKESDSKTVALPSTSRRAGKVSSEVCEREFCGSIDTCEKMFHPSVLACTVTNGSGKVSSSTLDEDVERGSKKKKRAKKHLKRKLKNYSASNNNEEHKIGMMGAWKDKLSRDSRSRSNEFDNPNLQSVEDLDGKIVAEDCAASKEVVQVQGQKVKFPEHLDYGDLQGESSEPLEVSNKTFHNIQTTVRGLATCAVGHSNVQVHADYPALHMVQALDSMDLEKTDDGSLQARTSLHLKEVDAEAYNMGASNIARSLNGISVVDEWSKSSPIQCCPIDLYESGATEVDHNSGDIGFIRDVVANVWTSGETIQNCRSNEESLSCSQQTPTSDIENHPSVETSSSMLDLDNIQDLRENRSHSANGGCPVNIFVSSSDTGTSKENGHTFSEWILHQNSEKKSKCIASSVCGSKLSSHCRCSCLNCTPVTTGPSVCSAENSSLNSSRNGRTREDLKSSQDQGFQRSITAENRIHNQGKTDQFIFLPNSKLQMKENSSTDVGNCPGDFWAEKKPEGKFIHRKQVNQSPFRGVPGGNSGPFSRYSRHQRSKSDQLDHSWSRFAPMTRLEEFSMDGGCVPHSCQVTNFSSLPQMLDQNLASGSTEVLMPCAALQDRSVPTLRAAQIDHVRDDSKRSFKPKEEPKEFGAVEASQISAKSACFQSSRKEFKEFACKILEAICASYESQTVFENVTLATSIPLCEFEKVLLSMAPVFKDSPVSLETRKAAGCCCTHVVAESCRNARRRTICKHQIADVTLNTLWQWYEEPSCFGLEVKCGGCPSSENNNSSDTQFQAFFVPYLSGMQLFGCTRMRGITGPNDAESADGVEGRYSFGVNFHNPPEFPLLVPEPTIVDDVNNTHIITGGHSRVSLGQKVKSKEADCRKCGPISDDLEKCDVELLYEFFDGEKPQQRRPFIDRIKELAMGQIAPESCRFGDEKVLSSVTIGELHPASWFAVAWYPIYRIPDGTFRSAFLTYHSLSYLCCGCPASSTVCGLSDCCMDQVTAPVVGLMSYNAQAEEWFSLTPEYKSESKEMEPLDLNPSEIIQQHLAKLEAAAATMAKGSSDESSIFKFKHLDYSFFQSHRR